MSKGTGIFRCIIGFLIAAAGVCLFYLLPERPDPMFPTIQMYIPRPWKAFAGLIGLWLLLSFYYTRHQWLERAKKGFSMFVSVAIITVIAYFATVFLLSLFSGASWQELLSALTVHEVSALTVRHKVALGIAALCIAGGIVTVLVLIFEDRAEHKTEYHQRGRRLISFGDAQAIASRLKKDTDPGIFWGMVELPSEIATTHFLVTGATGSGKTITLRLLMQSVLPRIGKGEDCRALVYDAKQDILSILAGMGLHCPVVTLNPFDKRCAAWDMARDITGPATAQQAASILIPENRHESQPFFSDAARHLLTGVLITFIKTAPEQWTLRDVVLAMRSKERLKQVLSTLPDTKDLLEYFANDNTAQNILSTLQSRMQRYEFIAAAWDRTTRKISLRDWLDGEFILVLGNDEATRTALDAINQVIFKRLTELILALPESATRRNWMFLDEVREAGELDGLGRLLTKGRSKGACVVLGFQDIDGLRDVYGTELANEIAGLCSNKAILRTDSSSTAEWASKLFGEREVLEIRQGSSESQGESTPPGRLQSSSNSGKSSSLQEQLNKREIVMTSEIMDMLPTNPANGLSGFYLTPAIGAYYARISGDCIGRELLPINEKVPNLEPRAESDQYLSSWSEQDFRRLGIASGKQPPVELEEDETSSTAVQHQLKGQDLGFLSQIKRE